ncbi:MAG: hypothetical protein M3238_02405 [Actinomycetota bacterium]|nr:hypothetical protein [Actinomycetota bacterium]
MSALAYARRLGPRMVPILVVALLLVLPFTAGSAVPKKIRPVAAGFAGTTRGKVATMFGLERRAPARTTDLRAYKRLGSWIDIYNHWPWRHPRRAVEKLHRKGVKTIFLQTSNYGAKVPIFKPRRIGRFIHAAHRRNMYVVAWYVPSFAHPKKDRRRSIAAIRFRNRSGERFDSFGMDIEATVVDHIWKRNRRLLGLSKWLRRKVGPDYPLGAITPDPVSSLYWPRFPYRRVRRLYDVFVPMGYFSFRARGYAKVRRYTVAGIRTIRKESGDPHAPIHVIGGIAGETKGLEVKAFVHAVKDNKVLGASYYDFTITTPEEWEQLRRIARRRVTCDRSRGRDRAARPGCAPSARRGL